MRYSLVLILLVISVSLLGCAKEPVIGGKCHYLMYKGKCIVTGVGDGSPDGPLVDFKFVLENYSLTNETGFAAEVITRTLSGGYPSQTAAKYINDCYSSNATAGCSIEINNSVPCMMTVISEGACSPIGFLFQGD